MTHRKTIASILAAVALGLSAAAPAAIIEMDQRDFTDATAGASLAVEKFDGEIHGPAPSPLTLDNGLVYSAPKPYFVLEADNSTELSERLSLTAPRTFFVAAPRINVFAMDVWLYDNDEYDVDIATSGGSQLHIDARRGSRFEGFFSFRVTDDTIQRVTFTAVGGGSGPNSTDAGISNYSFDDVAVGTLAASTRGGTTGGDGDRKKKRGRDR